MGGTEEELVLSQDRQRIDAATVQVPGEHVPQPDLDLVAMPMDLEAVIENAVKRQVAPIHQELKKLQKEVLSSNKKTTDVIKQLAVVSVGVKDLLQNHAKEKPSLPTLLTVDGVNLFKNRCFENIQLTAAQEEEDEVFDQLVEELRSNEWIILVETSAKYHGDLKVCFHNERSTLKQQVVRRIHKDFVGNTPEVGSSLTQAKSYLSTHIGNVSARSMLLLHHLAYLQARYLNTKIEVDTQDKAMRYKVQKEMWVVLRKRADKDTATVGDLKIRIKSALSDGFLPMK